MSSKNPILIERKCWALNISKYVHGASAMLAIWHSCSIAGAVINSGRLLRLGMTATRRSPVKCTRMCCVFAPKYPTGPFMVRAKRDDVLVVDAEDDGIGVDHVELEPMIQRLADPGR